MEGYSFTLPARVAAGLRRHAAAAAPDECCGALIGRRAGTRMDVQAMIPLENEAEETTAEYCIGAPTLLRLERQAELAGVDLVGFYHSHPVGDALPSSSDLEHAVPGYLYLVVGAVGEIRAWRLRDDRSGFDELSPPQPAGTA
jgi:proteasome lid subunit RPN8/RPN11